MPDKLDFYKKFYELSLDLFCLASPEGYIKDANPALLSKLGYEKAQLLNTPFLELLHPQDLSSTTSIIERLRSGATTSDFRNRYRKSDGHYITVSWSALVDQESGLIYAVGRDVSEAVNVTNRLAQIESALMAKSIFAETDHRGVITRVNENFCAISGYSSEELIGQTHKIVNSGHHGDRFFKDMWKTISSKRVWAGMIKNKKKNGAFYYVQTIIIPIVDQEGRITNYLAVRHDITDSLDHQSLLAKTLQILNETSSIARVGGWELDVQTSELTWTDETFNILEVEKKENQKPVLPEGLELFIPEHQLIVAEAVNRAIEFGEPYSLEVVARTRKGNELWVYTNGKANYVDGKVRTLSGTIQDINLRKLAEISYNLERQKSIQNARLASLGELAASMAHEINNPLGVISGYSELLNLSQDLSDDMREKVEIINKSTQRISHIVQSLKRFSQSGDAGDYKRYSIKGIIEESILLARPRFKTERVDVILDKSVSGEIVCNEIAIEQVFINLLMNSADAIKNLPEKWIRIELEDDDVFYQLRFTDSGFGIPLGIQYKIFDPFFSTKKPGEGTGLGLSVIKGILEEHRAMIEYDQKSKHTSFVIRFIKAPPQSVEGNAND